MPQQFDDPVQDSIWRTVLALNDCWTEHGAAGLEEYFHREMVAIGPAERQRIEGGEACVRAWTAFASGVQILHFREIDPRIHVLGDTATVVYYYDMAYVAGEETVRAGGRDLMVFFRENGKWKLVADHFSPNPSRV